MMYMCEVRACAYDLRFTLRGVDCMLRGVIMYRARCMARAGRRRMSDVGRVAYVVECMLY